MTIGPGMHVDDPSDDSLNLAMSESARPLYEAVKKFITDEVEPITGQFYELGEDREDRWSYTDAQLELLESVKTKHVLLDYGIFSYRTMKPVKDFQT